MAWLVCYCLGLDQSFHKSRAPGELVERIDGDVSALALLFREDWRGGVGLSLLAAVLTRYGLSARVVKGVIWRLAHAPGGGAGRGGWRRSPGHPGRP